VVEEDDVVEDSREVQSQRVMMVVERIDALTVVTEVEAVVEVKIVKALGSHKKRYL
jgi:hypothetical protein